MKYAALILGVATGSLAFRIGRADASRNAGIQPEPVSTDPIPSCMISAPWGGQVHNGDLICFAQDPRAPFAVFNYESYPDGPGWSIEQNPQGTLWILTAHGPGGEAESTTYMPVGSCARVVQSYCPPS